MILADTLAIASRKVVKPAFHAISDSSSPRLVIDFATLTGRLVSRKQYFVLFSFVTNYCLYFFL